MAGWAIAAHADPVSDFYTGKQIRVLIGFESGGGYDLYTRAVARFMGKHIPGNPSLVAQNMPGAGSLKAANYLYSVAPRDGSMFGTFSRSMPLAPLLEATNVEFAPREFNWLGSASKDILLTVSWHTSPVKTLEDAMKQELIVGSNARTSDGTRLPLLLNGLLGTRFKVINGYGNTQVALAMERGELPGMGAWSVDSLLLTKGDWVKEKKINILTQTGFKADPRIPEVPLAIQYAKTDLDRQVMELYFSILEMARPYAAPPGVPAERVAALSRAFEATMADPDFVETAAKSGLEINPSTASQIARMIDKAYEAPPEVIARAKAIFSGGSN
jgi:tripartite-type tricarboxylate transporter receptor subunit TctC